MSGTGLIHEPDQALEPTSTSSYPYTLGLDHFFPPANMLRLGPRGLASPPSTSCALGLGPWGPVPPSLMPPPSIMQGQGLPTGLEIQQL